MPLYEYRCHKCDQVFEVIQKFVDSPLTLHEQCGGQLERLISAPGIHFKGSGWYITDYARAGSGKDGKDGKNGSLEKSEAKPAETKPAESKQETKSTPAKSE